MPAVFLAAALAACHHSSGSAAPPPATASPAPTYTAELARYDLALAEARRLTAARGDDLPNALEAVSLWIERARLSGAYGDYAAAGKALGEAARRAGERQYPCVPAARLDYSLHRLAQATAELQRCPPSAVSDDVDALHADIDFYSGRYTEAETAYRKLLNEQPLPSNFVRLALFRSGTGAPAEAAALLEAAERRDHSNSPQLRAWLRLQRGVIAYDQGEFDEALALYRLAQQALPGWWLVDEHVAQLFAVQGRTEEAQSLYHGVIAASGHPEYMDALARLLREGPQPDAARDWVVRAAAIYEEQLKQFPEAACGHALAHYLLFGDPGRAVELARTNAALRPYGEARMRLAEALFRAGLAREAAREIDAILASPWNTAELHVIAAHVDAALGRSADAEVQRRLALGMNPLAFRMYPLAQPAQPDAID